jgi:hypothetical protein
MSATVIANGWAVLGDVVNEFREFNAFSCVSFNSVIEVIYIGLVVFAMVDFHGARIDVRFQSVVGVG